MMTLTERIDANNADMERVRRYLDEYEATAVVLAAEFRKAEAAKREVTFKCGDLFRPSKYQSKYLLTQCGPNKVVLVSLHGSSNRYTDPIEVRDVLRVTWNELQEMQGCQGQGIVKVGNINDFDLKVTKS